MSAEVILLKALNNQRCQIALSEADTRQRKGVGTILLRNLECRPSMLAALFCQPASVKAVRIKKPALRARHSMLSKDLRQSGSRCVARLASKAAWVGV